MKKMITNKIMEDYQIPETDNFGVEIECGISNNKCNCDLRGATHNFTYACLQNIFAKQKIKSYVPDDGHRTEYNKTYWHIGSDGSIRDYAWTVEVRSPILSGEEGLKKVLKVVQILVENGFEVNESCGFHVHFDSSKLKSDNLKSLIFLYTIFEKCINKITSKDREDCRHSRKMDFTETVGPRGGRQVLNQQQTLEKLETCSTIADIINLYPSRYKKVNVTAIQKFGTVEFRQHQGTLHEKRIIRWIRFLSLIVNTAKERNILDDKEDLLAISNERKDIVYELEKYLGYKILLSKKK